MQITDKKWALPLVCVLIFLTRSFFFANLEHSALCASRGALSSFTSQSVQGFMEDTPPENRKGLTFPPDVLSSGQSV